MKWYVPILCTLLSITGCSTPNLGNPEGIASTRINDSTNTISREIDSIEESSGSILSNIKKIDDHADDILLKPSDTDTVTQAVTGIKTEVAEAKTNTFVLNEALADLESANNIISDSSGRIEALEKENASLRMEDKQYRAEGLKNLYKFITLFFVIGFGMLIGGAFIIFWVNKKLGGAILGIGVLTVGFASASQYYLQQIAQVGLIVLIVGFLSALGIVLWMLVNGKKNETAMNEIVELIEEMKKVLSPADRKRIFGKHGFASKLTSDQTKRIIAHIKIKNGFVNKLDQPELPPKTPVGNQIYKYKKHRPGQK